MKPAGSFDALDAQDRAHLESIGALEGLAVEMEVTSPGRVGIGKVVGQCVETGLWDVAWTGGERSDHKRSELAVRTVKCQSQLAVPKPPMHILSYKEMIDLPDPAWLIEGLIMEQTSALLFGKSNSFKSFLAIDMACAIATGNLYGSWHGHKIQDGWPVLYVATEGSRGVAKQRVPGWYEAHQTPEENRDCLDLYPEEISLDSDQSVSDLMRSCAIRSFGSGRSEDWSDHSHAYKLVVIDIFGASMMGPETSDETARAWVRNINRIMREMNCAVLTVAHTGWADTTRARMHTHFWGSFDTRLIAEGDKDSLTTVLKLERHKDADSTGAWGFKLDLVTLPNGQTTLVPRLCDEVETKQKRRVSGKPFVALQALSEALIETGRRIAGPSYPTCPVVSVDHWRAMCDRHGLTDSDNPETARKAFNRARTALIEKGLVRQYETEVWKVSCDD